MRNILVYLTFLFPAIALHAVNDLTITPSPGTPTTQIMGQTAVDLRALAPGDLVSFDIRLENIDFHLAAFEFKIYFPIFILTLSDQDSDWVAGTGAVFVPGPALAGTNALVLPIDAAGNRIVPDQIFWKAPVGLVITDPLERWQGSPTLSHPGGLLGSIRFRFNGGSSCTSKIESVQVRLGPAWDSRYYDYFSDENGDRVTLVSTPPVDIHGLEGLPAYLGDPDKEVRGDANRDGVRDVTDGLPAAFCALNGPDSQTCAGGIWSSEDPAVFTQVFDANCDGSVGALDALPMALLGLGLRDRGDANQTKAVNTLAFQSSAGSVRIETPTTSGSLLYLALRHDGATLANPRFPTPMAAAGWTLLSQTTSALTEVLLLHEGDAPLPDLALDYNAGPGMTLSLDTALIQKADFTTAQVVPTLDNQ